MDSAEDYALSLCLTLMLLVVLNFGRYKMMQKTFKMAKPWHMCTHLGALSESYSMNTNMTGLSCFSKMIASLALALEWLTNGGQLAKSHCFCSKMSKMHDVAGVHLKTAIKYSFMIQGILTPEKTFYLIFNRPIHIKAV